MMVSGTALAASDVSNSGSGQSQAVTAIAAPIASAQTASLISGAIGGAISGGIGGGFGGGGGFSPGGGGGGFSPGGGGGGTLTPGTTSDSGNRAPNQTTYLNSRDTGRNAGAADKPFGVWIQGAHTWIDNGQVGASADGTAANLVTGLDYKLTDRLVIGVAGVYETVDVDTNTINGRGNVQNEGFGLSPYLGYQLTPRWTATLSGSYNWLSYDTKRTNNTISGSYDATRWTVNAGLGGIYSAGRFRMLPEVGVLYLEEKADAFTESNGQANASNTIKLGRLSAGGKVGYAMNTMMPYFKLIGEYDFEHPDALAIGNGTFTNDDDTGGKVGLGVDFFSAGPFSGNLEGSYDSLGRTDLDVWTISGRLRMRF
jgi:hypothetical protein